LTPRKSKRTSLCKTGVTASTGLCFEKEHPKTHIKKSGKKTESPKIKQDAAVPDKGCTRRGHSQKKGEKFSSQLAGRRHTEKQDAKKKPSRPNYCGNNAEKLNLQRVGIKKGGRKAIRLGRSINILLPVGNKRESWKKEAQRVSGRKGPKGMGRGQT